MRHRIGGLESVYMGLGCDNIPYKLDNTFSNNKKLNEVVKELFEEALNTICKKNDISGFDYKVMCDKTSYKIMFGYEPAYMYDPYFIVCITEDLSECYIEKGEAKGYYGKDVEIKDRIKAVDGNDDDFNEFINKWQLKIAECF